MDSTIQRLINHGLVVPFSTFQTFFCAFSPGEKITAKCMEKDGVKNRDEV